MCMTSRAGRRLCQPRIRVWENKPEHSRHGGLLGWVCETLCSLPSIPCTLSLKTNLRALFPTGLPNSAPPPKCFHEGTELGVRLEGNKFATLLVDLTTYGTETPWGRGGLLLAPSFSCCFWALGEADSHGSRNLLPEAAHFMAGRKQRRVDTGRDQATYGGFQELSPVTCFL